MSNDPIGKFKNLLKEAEQADIHLPNAAALATAGEDRQPTVRMVLLKDVDQRGFVFYTNTESRKANQLSDNPRASLCVWWAPLKRQVRVEGRVEFVTDSEADHYFATRPRGSQIGAWASQQSETLSSRDQLIAAVKAFDDKFRGRPVPRPAYWSGYRLVPERIEFWKEQPDRLHERELYSRDGDGWKAELLSP